jgi:signal peptidase I
VSPTILTHDPERLAALCALWQLTERDFWITLQGGSMAPTIRSGSRLCLRCHQSEFSIGDILAYRREGMLVVHRLVAIIEGVTPEERLYVCHGDHNGSRLDPPVPREAVFGVVTHICPPSFYEQARQRGVVLRERCRRAGRALRNRLLGSNGSRSAAP